MKFFAMRFNLRRGEFFEIFFSVGARCSNRSELRIVLEYSYDIQGRVVDQDFERRWLSR